MFVPFSARDFLDRAVTVYGRRTGIVDEPVQPGTPLEGLDYARVGELARAQAAGLDGLGIGQGERVAIVSHNSARLLTSFFGVCGYGRVLVPINFRLSPDEVAYIVEHSGARIVLIDPELEADLAEMPCHHRITLGTPGDAEMYRFGVEPEPWEPDENATATINYTSGTTARPKGVQLTHRNLWVNATTFALHSGASDLDVYLHTLPMFHANGWGMPFAMTGVGAKHIVLRKVDGVEILTPGRRARGDGDVRLSHGGQHGAGCSQELAGRDPRPGPRSRHCRRCASPLEDDRPGRVRAGLGVHADLWAHRDLAAPHAQSDAIGVGRSGP